MGQIISDSGFHAIPFGVVTRGVVDLIGRFPTDGKVGRIINVISLGIFFSDLTILDPIFSLSVQ